MDTLVPESDFTAPSEYCPRPELWHAPNAGATEAEVVELLVGLVRCLQPDYVVEIGAYQGYTTQALGYAVQCNGHGRVAAVEIDAESAEMAAFRCAGLPVEIIVGDSADFMPDGPVDLVWIDGGNDTRQADMERLLPHCGEGAIIGVHDVAPGKCACGEWEIGHPSIELRSPRGILLIQVHR